MTSPLSTKQKITTKTPTHPTTHPKPQTWAKRFRGTSYWAWFEQPSDWGEGWSHEMPVAGGTRAVQRNRSRGRIAHIWLPLGQQGRTQRQQHLPRQDISVLFSPPHRTDKEQDRHQTQLDLHVHPEAQEECIQRGVWRRAVIRGFENTASKKELKYSAHRVLEKTREETHKAWF